MTHPYPLFLHLEGRLAVVVGGGTVGRRKATSLLASGAHVRLVCLEPRPSEESSEKLDWRTEPYHVRHLVGTFLVFAAAIPKINHTVVADARARGLLVCSSSDPEEGDFLTAALLHRGDLTVALGTGGAAPALTRALRQRLGNYFDAELGPWLSLLAELRPLIQQQVSDLERRRQLWERLCEERWLERMRQEDRDTIRAAMIAAIMDSASPNPA